MLIPVGAGWSEGSSGCCCPRCSFLLSSVLALVEGDDKEERSQFDTSLLADTSVPLKPSKNVCNHKCTASEHNQSTVRLVNEEIY